MNGIMAARVAVPAFLEDGEQRALKEKYLPDINRYANVALGADDIHVRGMLLCNSEPDFYYSRFTTSALDEITELLPGRSVMIGHEYSRAPIARFFAARRVFKPEGRKPKEECYHVEGLYYTPRDPEGDAAVRRIDTGVWKEVSIGFRCLDAPCTICREYIGSCGHSPGELYEQGGIALYEMENINAVFEGSMVFAGGQKGTSTFVPDGARSATSGDLRWDEIPAMKRAMFEKHDRGDIGLLLRGGRHEAQRNNVVNIDCLKDRFETVDQAKRWARDNDFRVSKVRDQNDAFRFHQRPAEQFESVRVVQVASGVRASVGKRKQTEDAGRKMSVEEFLSR